MTVDPRSPERLAGLRSDAVEQWILSHVDGLTPPLSFEPVGRGRSNLTYLVLDATGRAVVLRRPPLGSLVESAHDLEREHGILSRLAAAGQPVPRPLAFCDDVAVTGAQFFVMERIEGVVADSPESVEDGLSPEARAAVAPALARTLASLHAVDLRAAGLERPGKGGDYAARQVRRWSRQWELTKTRSLPALESVTQWLEARLPPQEAVTIVHGDYTVFNCILGHDGDVRAILDWELSTIGDPVADLAWCVMWWPDDEDGAAPGATPVPLMPGFGRRAELVAEYMAASGRSIAHLGWWRVLSYWKLAVILEGILSRWMEDPSNGGADPGALAPGVEKLVALAQATADSLES
jgi:aminoglycoside phosphotransferase (APT) family kinase protein